VKYPVVMSELETLSVVLGGKSISRFGDGELKLALGRKCISQDVSQDLTAELRLILREPGLCLVAIPNIINRIGPKDFFWDQYKRPPWTEFYNPSVCYGSAFITRPDSAPWNDTPGYWAMVRSIWADRDVVLVKGCDKSLNSGIMPEAKSVEDVTVPRTSAYAVADEIFDRLKDEKRRVLLCAGATATVLAWRLAQVGVHAIDLGHIGMTMRKAGTYRCQ